MTSTEVVLANHEHRITSLEEESRREFEKVSRALERLEQKIDKFQFWLIGVLGGVILSLVLLVLNQLFSGQLL